MSQAIVEAVRVKYPTPLGAEHGAFLIDLARTLGGGAGLLAKDWGTFVRLPDGRGVAQDIICYRVGEGATHFDVLADGEGAAEPRWHEVGPIDPKRYVDVGGVPTPPAPVPVPPTPPVPPPPAPVPPSQPCQCGEVVELLAAMRLENAERHDTIRTQLHRLEVASSRARKVRGKVSWSGQLDGEVSGVPV